jgi:hypothetical protein
MLRITLSACGTLLIGSTLGLALSAQLPVAADDKTEESVVTQLFRRDYPKEHYASYLLEVRSESTPVVRAYLDLRQKSKRLASIPVLPTSQKNETGGQSTFLRANCIAIDEISDTSYFYVFVTDPLTGKTINEIKVFLSSAKPVPRLPGE